MTNHQWVGMKSKSMVFGSCMFVVSKNVWPCMFINIHQSLMFNQLLVEIIYIFLDTYAIWVFYIFQKIDVSGQPMPAESRPFGHGFRWLIRSLFPRRPSPITQRISRGRWTTSGPLDPSRSFKKGSTMWPPPVINWFINPSNYSYKYHKP